MKMQIDPIVLSSADVLGRLGGYDADDEKLVGQDMVFLAFEVVAALAVCGAANWAATWF